MYKQSLLSASIVLALSSTSALAEDYALFDEVVVSSTRTNQTLINTAASVTVISDKQIEENMAKDVDEIFEYTPGVTMNSSSRQGAQTINIRGMEGKRVKILVDGSSQPGSFDGGPYAFINSSGISIDPDMLKSVEIIKGAASSLHGSDAIGGVVAFETKDPSDFLKDGEDFGGQAKLSYSSEDNSFSEHVALANRFGDLETLVAYTRRDGEELQNFRNSGDLENYAVENQDTSADNLLVKLQYQLNESHRIEFLAELIKDTSDSDIYHSSYDSYTGEDDTKQNRFAIKHIWFADGAIADTVTSKVSYISKEENGVTKRFKPAGPGFPPYVPANNDNLQTKDYDYTEDKLEIETQLDKEINNHYLVYGATYTHSDISNTNMEYNSDPATDDQLYVYTPDAKEQKFGLFVQDEISLMNNKLVVTPGVRFDYFSTDPGKNTGESLTDFSDSAVTGRLGTTYKLTDTGTVFGQISQGFRAPSFDELYYTYDNPGHGYVNDPNPDLKSETSISYELGYRHNTQASSSEIAAYYSDYDDFIETVVTKKTGGTTHYSNVNLESATIKGVEFSNTLLWDVLVGAPEGISTHFVASYTEGEDGNGNALNSVNPWNAVLGLNYDAPNQNWGTSLKLNYTADKSGSDINFDDENGGNAGQAELPSATVVDLTAYYKPMKDLTIRGGVFNLTNEEYYRWNDIRGDDELYKENSQAERNYGISAKYEF
ncbi:TonB-dependent receptor [Vibrio chagasii]|uniref:TonB-dependent hemoglobin/transferrin/lactoferrin family receptor n=1 Tax=Vibrio TaxID=662 RepID=UPI00076AAFFB|nr:MULTISPECIES: TonB-dependent hemoglobin/transferrin/lactoferrin family receptor [Vibrio]MDE9381780.1 TonB-dependent hemoglobin/transferrin/lactoferrin family receptor [Vibrio alginolyticus]MCG9606154.1 TonB-dependent hemoglobin/transferrin/lactoferrin family receptor [Vibrio chagasii]NOI94964.1 TonB-dependent hemoglobin/transferrin/lactoferrin family receptor [Vibrio sp. T3Y01]PQJ50960.1 TonB-dependent receptor [Vibrio splendidus]CAH6782606.1 TonB-dependent receptor [Vibrio chagasii]